MKTMDRNNKRKAIGVVINKNRGKIFKKYFEARVVLGHAKRRANTVGNIIKSRELNYNKMSEGKRSAKALKELKNELSGIEFNKNDPYIKNLLEGIRTYAK